MAKTKEIKKICEAVYLIITQKKFSDVNIDIDTLVNFKNHLDYIDDVSESMYIYDKLFEAARKAQKEIINNYCGEESLELLSIVANMGRPTKIHIKKRIVKIPKNISPKEVLERAKKQNRPVKILPKGMRGKDLDKEQKELESLQEKEAIEEMGDLNLNEIDEDKNEISNVEL